MGPYTHVLLHFDGRRDCCVVAELAVVSDAGEVTASSSMTTGAAWRSYAKKRRLGVIALASEQLPVMWRRLDLAFDDVVAAGGLVLADH